MAEKKITLVTCIYNKAPYIETWAASLAEQTFLDKTRILVTDDCSTDGSLELIEKYAVEYNLPMELTRNEKNMGLMYSVRNAYRKIDTDYFTVLDADDFYVSPQKIEKAVNFLEKNPDYSLYACNSINIYPDGTKKVAFSRDKPSRTYSKISDTPFFQTASTTFRNYFSPKLLDAIDKETEGHRTHPFQGDAFRNVLAFHFGKFYFENSFDVAWRKEIGIWGKASPLSHDLANMKSYFVYANFYTEQFGSDDNTIVCLGVSFDRYMKILNYITDMLNSLKTTEFEETDEFKKILNIKDVLNLDATLNDLLEQYKLYCSAGLRFIPLEELESLK